MPAKNKYDPAPDSSLRPDSDELLESPRRLEERIRNLKRRYVKIQTKATSCTSHLSLTGSGSGSGSCRRMEDLVLEMVMLENEIKSLRTRQRDRICEIGRVLTLMDDPASVRLLRERCVGLKPQMQLAREYGCSEHRIRDLLTKAAVRFAAAYDALQSTGNRREPGKHESREDHGTHGGCDHREACGNRGDPVSHGKCGNHSSPVTCGECKTLSDPVTCGECGTPGNPADCMAHEISITIR